MKTKSTFPLHWQGDMKVTDLDSYRQKGTKTDIFLTKSLNLFGKLRSENDWNITHKFTKNIRPTTLQLLATWFIDFILVDGRRGKDRG